MARKKKEAEENRAKVNTDGVVGLVGSTTEQAISDILETNLLSSIFSIVNLYAVLFHELNDSAYTNCPGET